MLLDPRAVEAAEQASQRLPVPPLPPAASRAIMRAPIAATELDRRASFLAADGQQPTPLEFESLLGKNDLLEISFVDRIQLVSRSVCRLTLKTERGTEYATGFLVGPGLLLTNHHVLGDAGAADTALAEFGYRYDVSGQLQVSQRFRLDSRRLFVADAGLDYALCALSPRSIDAATDAAALGYVRLIPRPGKVSSVDFVTIIQHPDGKPMQIALRENEVIATPDDAPDIWYRADTAHGSSGSPVFNDSLQVAALHRSGLIQRDPQGRFMLRNGGVATSLAGLSEYDVLWQANVGTRVSRICEDLLRRAAGFDAATAKTIETLFERDDLMSAAVRDATDSAGAPGQAPTVMPAQEVRSTVSGAGAGGLSVLLPLTLRISLEPASAAAPAPAAALEPEALRMQIPVIYDALDERTGFDPDFLDLSHGAVVEMPKLTAKGRAVAAPQLDGSGPVLKYQRFSVVVHKTRRLPMLTASNVDWRPASRPLDPATGRSYSRTRLSGIPEGIAEQWVLDERLAAQHQLPDVFYTEDRQAFDKGHVVRRDDVCWGTSFEDVQMGNGDTYHVTNCTPQIKGFNQSARGVANWGDFDNEVQRVTRATRVIVFAGPVLAPQDRWFHGRDDRGALRIQVPSAFWKIVVAKESGRAKAWGFVLAQDVTGVTEAELKFDAVWKPRRRSVAAIQSLLRGWIDLSALAAIDQPL